MDKLCTILYIYIHLWINCAYIYIYVIDANVWRLCRIRQHSEIGIINPAFRINNFESPPCKIRSSTTEVSAMNLPTGYEMAHSNLWMLQFWTQHPRRSNPKARLFNLVFDFFDSSRGLSALEANECDGTAGTAGPWHGGNTHSIWKHVDFP